MKLYILNLCILIVICGELQVIIGLRFIGNVQLQKAVVSNIPFHTNPKNYSIFGTDSKPTPSQIRPSSFLTFPCGGSHKLAAGQKLIIKSPNYPNAYYSWAKCRWNIESINTTLMRFSCSAFVLEPTSLCNAFSDFLLVESPSGGARWFCGTENPEVLVSPSFVLTFWSNFGANYQGFECTIEALEEPYAVFPTIYPILTSRTSVRPVSSRPPQRKPYNCRCGLSSTPSSLEVDEVALADSLDLELGRQSPTFNKMSERVINGYPAAIHEFPWLVALEVKNQVICGGNIINDLYILTAAHCLKRNLLPIVIAGDHSLSLPTETPFTKRFMVEHLTIHEDYDPYTLDNDVALLKLKESLDFFSLFPYIAPVCPPTLTNYVGRMATAAGWGLLDESGSFPTDVVNKVDVAVIDLESCQRDMDQLLNVEVTENMLCCVSEGADVCKGDSGGPLMVKEGERWLLIGIVSWGYGCARKDAPAVYVNLSKYMEWISINSDGAQTCQS